MAHFGVWVFVARRRMRPFGWMKGRAQNLYPSFTMVSQLSAALLSTH